MVISGTPVGWTEADTHERRKVAVAWLEWACGAPEHTEVPESDERYRVVTADLDPGSFGVHPDPFSSCAVLAHWMLLQVGCRQDWIDHPKAPGGWRGDGGIVGRLTYRGPGSNDLARPWTPDCDVQGGDIVIISRGTASQWTGVHVVCHIDSDSEGVWSTAEYGQPGGKLRLCKLDGDRLRAVLHGGSLSTGRHIRSWLSLDAVLRDAYARGLLVEPAPPQPD